MRLPFVLAPLLLATPALAQERDPADVARVLQNPAVQEGAAAAIGQLADILLDTRVGALAALGDPDVRPGDTLRDLKRRDDPDFEARLRRDTRRSLREAGAVAGAWRRGRRSCSARPSGCARHSPRCCARIIDRSRWTPRDA